MLEQLARYISEQFTKGKGAEFTLNLKGLPTATDLATVWVIPSLAYDGVSNSVLVVCDTGGTIQLTGSKVSEWVFVQKGFSLPVSQMLSHIFQSFAQYTEQIKLSVSAGNTTVIPVLTTT
jgi:hypothetical protein